MGNFECLELENLEKVAVVKFRDPKVMDPVRIAKLGEELLELLEDENSEDMVVDFENVSFFSSAAINKLIVLEKHVRARGGEIRLTNLRPEVRDLFSYTHLDQVFKIQENMDQALASLRDS